MEILESLLVFAGIAIVAYGYAKRKRLEQDPALIASGENKNTQLNVLKEELDRRAKIIKRVEEFVKGSKFIEPIATWRNDNIYKYVFNEGYLYEFNEILSENNQRVGIDEESLCFKQFCYKRVVNSSDFIQKFGKALAS